MASFKPFCWGPPLKRYPILDLGLVEGPAGYRLHPNPKLGARQKVEWEKIEKFASKPVLFFASVFCEILFGIIVFFSDDPF